MASLPNPIGVQPAQRRDPLAKAEEIIRSTLAEGEAACFTCSFQAEDVALLHLLIQQFPRIPVLFLETGYHFPEVVAYRDQLAREWNLNLVNLEAKESREDQEKRLGMLNVIDPNQCCHLRKVIPLQEGLKAYRKWFTGLRREQSPTRANLQPKEFHQFPTGHAVDKVSPLFDWTMAEVASYLSANDIPRLPLYDQGYTSIGCEPCTKKPEPGSHARSGRWGGAKLECGLHTVTTQLEDTVEI